MAPSLQVTAVSRPVASSWYPFTQNPEVSDWLVEDDPLSRAAAVDFYSAIYCKRSAGVHGSSRGRKKPGEIYLDFFQEEKKRDCSLCNWILSKSKIQRSYGRSKSRRAAFTPKSFFLVSLRVLVFCCFWSFSRQCSHGCGMISITRYNQLWSKIFSFA